MNSSVERLKEIACPTKKEKTIDFALTGDDIRIIYDALCARWKQYDEMDKKLSKQSYLSPDAENIVSQIDTSKRILEHTKYKFGSYLGHEGN